MDAFAEQVAQALWLEERHNRVLARLHGSRDAG
jgi:hypothetical protein